MSDSPSHEPLAWSIEEGAQRLGISRPTLDRLHQRGEIEYVRIGRRCVVTEDELRRFLDAQRLAS